jgi:hypothetical protein
MQHIRVGRYQNWKGNYYKVLGLVLNSDDPGNVEVLYQSESDGKYWRRKVDEFFGTVNRDERGTIPRFVKVDDNEKPFQVFLHPLEVECMIHKLALKLITLKTGPVICTKYVASPFELVFFDDEEKLQIAVTLERAIDGFMTFFKMASESKSAAFKTVFTFDDFDEYTLTLAAQFIAFRRLKYA